MGENFGEFGESKLIRQYFIPPNLPLKFLQSFVLLIKYGMGLLVYSSTVLNCSGQVLTSVKDIVSWGMEASGPRPSLVWPDLLLMWTLLLALIYC